jgi:hypothetical protein
MKKSELLQCIRRLDDRVTVLEERVKQLEDHKDFTYIPYYPTYPVSSTYPTYPTSPTWTWGTPTVTCEQSRIDKMRTHTG